MNFSKRLIASGLLPRTIREPSALGDPVGSTICTPPSHDSGGGTRVRERVVSGELPVPWICRRVEDSAANKFVEKSSVSCVNAFPGGSCLGAFEHNELPIDFLSARRNFVLPNVPDENGRSSLEIGNG